MSKLIISDIHLGSSVCQAKKIIGFLKEIKHGKIKAQELIINGDFFDSWDFRRLSKHHWNVLSEVRKLSDHMHVIWNNGNHDGPAEVISHLIGVEVSEEYRFESGDKRVLCMHGHTFDTLIDAHPRLTYLADLAYRFLMRIDPSFSLARSAKRASKTFMRNAERIEKYSREYASKSNCDIVCLGHTHLATAKPHIGYFNSGCWTEKVCNYLEVKNGQVELKVYDD